MNIIVLVKQVPDVSHIPEEAWDREKGALRRGLLDTVFNPLDLQALTCACGLKKDAPDSRIVCLTMGPPQAKEVLADCLARGADEAVLLTDTKFAGADTPATAYALAQAIRRIAREMFRGGHYLILAGMQSVDGDTAQVPPQVAEELGIEHIAYARALARDEQGELVVTRIGSGEVETVVPRDGTVLVTVTACVDTVPRSFARTRAALARKFYLWDAAAVGAEPHRIGFKGSRTWVCRISCTMPGAVRPCVYPERIEDVVDGIERDFSAAIEREDHRQSSYVLGDQRPSYNGEVWVCAEVRNKELAPVSLELITKAKKLADSLRERVGVLLLGDQVRGLVPELFFAGADKVYLAEHPLLKVFSPWVYKKAVAEAVLCYKPQIVLFGATPLGRELAPRVAYATGSGLTADCTGLEIDDHVQGDQHVIAALKQTRPALGGNIMATILAKDSAVQMATVRPGVFPMPRLDFPRNGEVIPLALSLEPHDVRSVLVATQEPVQTVKLGEADIVVAGGRGFGSRADFEKYLMPLADVLGQWLHAKVEIAGSRMAVDDGFIGHERQVGQTGQTVKPKLYIAVGISGAVQHITGMQNSRVVCAINRDSGAKIFDHADYGVVGALEDVVPKLVDAIRRRCL